MTGQVVVKADKKAGGDGAGITVLLVDDHAVMRDGMAALVNRQPDMEVVAQATDGVAAAEETEVHRPDAILMDVDMPKMNGIEATRRIKSEFPEAAIVGLSLHDGEKVRSAMKEAGADAYLNKSASAREIVATVRQVCQADSETSSSLFHRLVGRPFIGQSAPPSFWSVDWPAWGCVENAETLLALPAVW